MYLTEQQLEQIGFKSIGENVKISEKASIYNPQNISLGSNIRIDDWTILSAGDGGIEIGDYVHIAAYSSLIGQGKITMEDYTGISQRVSLISSTDDFSGQYFVGPTIQTDKRNVFSAPITIKKYSVIGIGSTVLPGVTIGENCGIAAMSMVNHNIEEDSLYAGVPAKFIGERKKNKFI